MKAIVAILAVFFAVFLVGGQLTGSFDPLEPRADAGAAGGSGTADGRARRRAAAGLRPARTARARARVAQARRGRPATERAWIARIDALCRRAASDSAALVRPATPHGMPAYLSRVARLNERYNDAFAALEPPPGREADAARILTLLRDDERLVARLVRAVRSRNAGALLATADRLAKVAARESRLLAQLGASACGSAALGGSGAS